MQSITVQSHVGEDGILRLQIPVGVKDTDLEVTITVKSQTIDEIAAVAQSNGWPPGFFEATYGCLKDDPIERPPQGEYEEVTSAVDSQTMDELEATAQSNGWPPGFFRRTAGAWLGPPLERPPQGEHEKRDELL